MTIPKPIRDSGMVALWLFLTTLSVNSYAQQFAKYKCSAKGENGEIILETREIINSRILKESAFSLFIDFDQNTITFQDSAAYPFKFSSNKISEKTTSEQYSFASYETAPGISQDLRIDRRSGEFYFSRTWDITYNSNSNSTSQKIIELRGSCRLIQEQLNFTISKFSPAKPFKFGDVAIPAQFSFAWDFSEGLASVWARDAGVEKSGAIDKNGNLKIPLNFSLLRSFISGLAGACSQGVTRKCGYINSGGQWVIEPIYDEVWDFKDGFATVSLGKDGAVLDTKTGKYINEGGKKSAYIDARGEILGNKFFDKAYDFNEGMAPIGAGEESEGRLWGFVDRSGNEVIPPKFGPGLVSAVEQFSEGLAPALQGDWQEGKYGYIEKSGKFAIPPIYSQAANFSEGKAMVCKDVRPPKRAGADKSYPYLPQHDVPVCSFIDRNAKLLFPLRSYYYGNFHGGLATACRRDNYWDAPSPSCGYIDANGKLVIGERFISAEDFKNGYAKVSISRKPLLFGLINKKGDFVIKPIYSDLGSVSEGFLAFQAGEFPSGKWGYLWAR